VPVLPKQGNEDRETDIKSSTDSPKHPLRLSNSASDKNAKPLYPLTKPVAAELFCVAAMVVGFPFLFCLPVAVAVAVAVGRK
jgi:hypothetical protein